MRTNLARSIHWSGLSFAVPERHKGSSSFPDMPASWETFTLKSRDVIRKLSVNDPEATLLAWPISNSIDRPPDTCV